MAGDSCKPVVGLVLARGGSMKIPMKNLAPIGCDSLLSRCLKTMKIAKCFDSIWVSTDDATIASVALTEGAKVHQRKSYAASNDASSVLAIQEFLQAHEECQEGLVCLVQCTSPFLSPHYLHQGLQMMAKHDSVFAAVRSHALRWNLNKESEFVALNFDPSERPSRQHWCGEMVETGMFYLTAATNIINRNLLQWGRIGIVEIAEEDSIDIDSPFDLQVAEMLLQYKTSKPSVNSSQ